MAVSLWGFVQPLGAQLNLLHLNRRLGAELAGKGIDHNVIAWGQVREIDLGDLLGFVVYIDDAASFYQAAAVNGQTFPEDL